MNARDDFDPLDELLRRPPAGPADNALADRALAQTLPVLGRRRLLRRASWTLALAGCYLAGLTTMGLWQWAQQAPELGAPMVSEPASVPETRMVERPKTPFERLRDAGNEAWRRQGDIERAIRLYAQAIEVATPEELRISTADDNWLLMALKQDRVEEKPNAMQPDES
jgi:hypothetical protein